MIHTAETVQQHLNQTWTARSDLPGADQSAPKTISAQLEDIEKSLYQLCSNISVSADRLYGSRPEPCVSEATPIAQSVNDQVALIARLVQAAMVEAHRLDNI